MESLDESFIFTKGYNFLDKVKNADQSFNETNEPEKLLQCCSIPREKTERVPKRQLGYYNAQNINAERGKAKLLGAHFNGHGNPGWTVKNHNGQYYILILLVPLLSGRPEWVREGAGVESSEKKK